MNKYATLIAIVLAIALLVLIFGSWLLSALPFIAEVRSLLSSEGIRWFLGRMVDNLSSPAVVWLALLSMAWGSVRNSGLMHVSLRTASLRERMALTIIAIEVLVGLLLLILLAFVPHAVLLNVTGTLVPGPLVGSFVPCVCLLAVVTGSTFGVLTERLHSVYDICDSMSDGIRLTASWWLPLFLFLQVLAAARYVFF